MNHYEKAGERFVIGLAFVLLVGTVVGLLMMVGVIG